MIINNNNFFQRVSRHFQMMKLLDIISTYSILSFKKKNTHLRDKNQMFNTYFYYIYSNGRLLN